MLGTFKAITVRVTAALSVALCCINTHAQTDSELSSWRLVQELQLSDEIATDPNVQILFASDHLLLVASPGLQTGDCGRVLVFSNQTITSTFRLLQELSAADFDEACSQTDGFGFALAFAEGNLFVGAPGPVLSDGELAAGEVFVYSLDSGGFDPVQRITGAGETGNLAWGTHLETDGTRLLAQGNEMGDLQTIQGFANPRSVNLLTQDAEGRWRVLRTFSETQDTQYGQDFGINESAIYIARHRFIDIFSTGAIRSLPRFDSFLDIYNFDENGFLDAQPSQTIASENILFDSLETMPAANYVAAQNQSFSLYQSIANQAFTPTRATEYQGYRLRRGAWVESSQISIDILLDFSKTVGQVGQFSFNNTFLLRTGDRGQLVLDTLSTPAAFQSLEKREQFFNPGFVSPSQQSTEAGQRPLVGDNEMVIVSRQNNRLQLDVYLAIPALDPAITQAWWFGPEFDGQGVTFEVLTNNRLLMHWFTYDLSGNQMWIRGVGQLNDGEIDIELRRAMGPSFTFGEFASNDRVVEAWGQATIRFNDCTSGVLNYTSTEFGSGELPLMPLVNNRLDCDRGTIFARSSGVFLGSPGIAGSFFDPGREGEGFILMPIPNTRQPLPGGGGVTRIANRVVGIWLTYTPTGEQAWYYLGVYEQCRNVSFDCALLATQTPRSTTGPVFGPAYNPDERISVPWGTAEIFNIEAVPGPNPIQLLVDNPDGTGILFLQQSTQPVGYDRLTR